MKANSIVWWTECTQLEQQISKSAVITLMSEISGNVRLPGPTAGRQADLILAFHSGN